MKNTESVISKTEQKSLLQKKIINKNVINFLIKKDVAGLAAMIDAGLNVNHINSRDQCIIYSAVIESDTPEMIRMLIGRGGNVNTQSGQTPLKMALMLDHFGAVAALLDGGAHPDVLGESSAGGMLPLCYAMSEGKSTPSLRLLLQAGASLNYFEKITGLTPLQFCINNNNLKGLMVLLEFGEDPRNISFSINHNSIEYATLLLNKGAPTHKIVENLTAWMDCQSAQDAVDEILKNAEPTWRDTQYPFANEPKKPKNCVARP